MALRRLSIKMGGLSINCPSSLRMSCDRRGESNQGRTPAIQVTGRFYLPGLLICLGSFKEALTGVISEKVSQVYACFLVFLSS